MAEELANLVDMGFEEAKAKKALEVSNNNLAEALEWLVAHANDSTPTTSSASQEVKPASEPTEGAASGTLKLNTAEEAKASSLKCDDCGALLRNEDEVMFHAGKTGHENYSESNESVKPKTKEEIEEAKKRLADRLVRIRKEKAEKERQEQIEQERARRKQGREINEIKQKFYEDELKRIAEEKRREKLADAAHKQKVKEQIAADREAFKRAQEKAKPGYVEPAAAPQPVKLPAVVTEKKDYDECKIQIRLTDGKSIVQTFKAKEPLASVRLWIEMNRTDGAGKFNLMQTFPRKVYTDEDMARSLVDLGLVPATSLVIQNA